MSLRDDLDVVMYVPDANSTKEAYLRLCAALTPAAIKWLEALPGILELIREGAKTPEHSFDRRSACIQLDDAVWEAVKCAALNAQDNKEQK